MLDLMTRDSATGADRHRPAITPAGRDRPRPIVQAWPAPRSECGWPGRAKRGLDIVVAVAGLLIAAVPCVLIGLAIRLDSPGPMLFRQTRIGRQGRRFTLLKFRTMHLGACLEPACHQARRDDPRVTRLGRWLRRTSLDELPQLLNVLGGEMSIVGPRPHAPGTRAGDRLFEEVTSRYHARHLVRPGLTGLAQVRGLRGETDTEEKLLARLASDLEYVQSWSLGLDLWIIGRTVGSVARMRNAY